MNGGKRVAGIAHFFDPVALALVFGGSLGVAAMRSTRGDMARAFAALRPLFRADPEADAVAALRAVGAMEAMAHARGLPAVDRVETAGRFLRRAAMQLSDATDADGFADWARDELAARRLRHESAAGFWRAVADAGPAMGMIGTIIGLIGMFSAMDDMAAIGPAMALAMLTTLYGIVVSGALAGPVAARLERLSEAERAWQARALERMERLARAEIAPRPRAVLHAVPREAA